MSKKMDAVAQELKSERVQEELRTVGGDPLVIWLKSERVQKPSLAPIAGPAEAPVFELAVNPHRRMKIDLIALQISITLEGPIEGGVPFAGPFQQV
jgi:hypothetical protein